MFVEGRVLSTDGTPIPNAVIETWETDADGKWLVGPVVDALSNHRFMGPMVCCPCIVLGLISCL